MVARFRWAALVSVSIGLAAVTMLGSGFAFQIHTAPATLVVLDAAKVLADKPVASQIPPGWELKVNVGTPDVTLTGQGDAAAVHFRSTKSSFGLEKPINIDPAQLPYLSWHWMVTQLPPRGDFRHTSTDDQAAQVMVAFDDRHIISYIWDSNAPQGVAESASFIPLVHIFDVVCRSGAAEANRWLDENRNIAADYQRLFGKPAPHVKGLRLQINSQHTGSVAESYFGQVVFRNAQS
jgi:hypothetical protein